jgi:hypothetical protein
LVAFSASGFHAGLTVRFFVDYMQHILTEGFNLCPSFKQILTTTLQSALECHNNIVHVHHDPETSTFLVWAYVFTHVQWHCGDFGETSFQLPFQSVRVLKSGLKLENKAPPIFMLAGGKAVKVNMHPGSQKGMNYTCKT